MLVIPNPKAIEDALTLFPHVTVSVRCFWKTWQFRVESEPLFIYEKSAWRRTWQAAFLDAWKRYSNYDIADREIALARRER
jgi:hypothetical protein